MNLLPMHYYLVVVEKQSISKAAAALNITQQTLSAHMAALEKELQCRLFIRSPKFSLTYGGRIFLEYARQFEHLNEALQEEFSDIAGEEEGSITIGIAPTRGRIWLRQLLPAYRRLCPHIQIHVLEDSNTVLIDQLLQGRVDVIFVNLTEEPPELCSRIFKEEEIVLLVPKTILEPKLLAQLQQTGQLRLLEKQPFLFNRPHDIAGRMGRMFLKKAGFVPKISVTSGNVETLLELCVQGMGACFCPENLVRGVLNQEQLDQLGIVHLGAVYPIRMAWLNKAYQPKSVARFLQMCKNFPLQ